MVNWQGIKLVSWCSWLHKITICVPLLSFSKRHFYVHFQDNTFEVLMSAMGAESDVRVIRIATLAEAEANG